MQIANNKVVQIHYTLKNDAGETLDTSDGREPLVYLQGSGAIIPGLESALDGKTTGDKLDVVIEPKDGYGERQEAAIQQVPMAAFAGIENLQVGMQLQAETERGPVPVKVAAIEDDTVTIDANHALAGERLHFAVSVEDIRDATEEEIAHGHVH